MLIEIEMKVNGEAEAKIVPIRSIFVSAALTGSSGSMQSKPRPQTEAVKKNGNH